MPNSVIRWAFFILVGLGAAVGFVACGGGAAGTSDSASTGGGTCTYTDNTTETGTANSLGCKVRTRDTSSCQASRIAQGLSGFWLDFSCAVTLTKSGASVYLSSKGVPDHMSYYFGSSHACYESFNSTGGRSPNPGTISVLSINMEVPFAPAEKTPTKTDIPMGGIGLAVNGVLIFNNKASPSDNIYDEVETFDSCEGHPAVTHYHYHIEPAAISNNDFALIGVLRDGFPVYGKKDADGNVPNDLDSYGGHEGPLPSDTGTTMYHYHLMDRPGNNTNGDFVNAYFMAGEKYFGTPGNTCTNCNP